jgi:hypothetical protein
MTYRTVTATLALALAACQQGPSDQNIAIDGGNAANATVETLPPDEGNSATEAANATSPEVNESEDDSENSPSPDFIPAQYRGRWGMTANDCDPRRSDNKGLMTVRDQSIKFYESVASLQEIRPAIATSFSGVYGFEGEGQTWERVITLTRTGDTLKRAQADANYTYTRCK